MFQRIAKRKLVPIKRQEINTRNHAQRFFRPALAAIPPIAACFLQWMLWPLINPYVWFLFYPAVFISSWIGGWRSSIFATMISTIMVWFLFVSPQYTFIKDNPKLFFPAGVFMLMGIVFSIFNEHLRQAKQRASLALEQTRAANDELLQANQQITQLWEKTLQLDKLKTQFFSNVSHELRTPLTLVLGPTERMLNSPMLPDVFRRDLEVIERNAKTLLRHVNDILDGAKIEAKQMQVDYANVDLVSLLKFIAGHFEVLASEKHMRYSIDVPAKLFAQVDSDKIQRIVLNLLSNAFKFSPEGGCVRLKAQEVKENICIEVSDNGPGIPPDKREEVFERFHQLDGGATRRFSGTGLGLAIARDFIELHHGQVAIDTAPEGGALFKIILPKLAPPGVTVNTSADNQFPLEEINQIVEELKIPHLGPTLHHSETGPLILVVEDNLEMNRFLCENLCAAYRVESAFDGEEGLKKAYEFQPNLIITDIMMPKMSGDEMVSRIAADSTLSHIPILVLSAKADDELRISLLRKGAKDYLIKPFAIEELRARVDLLVSYHANLHALKKSEMRYRELFEQAPDGIFIAGVDDRYSEVNGAGCRMLDYAREDITGKTFVDFIPAEDVERACQTKGMLVNGAIQIAEYNLRKKDGTLLPVEVSAKILPDGRWQGFFRDISERKVNEEKQHQATVVFDNTQECICITDSRAKIITVNPAFEAVTGYKREEVIGKNTRLHKSGRQGNEFYQQMWEALRKSGQWQGEIWNKRKNGDIYPAWESISAVKDPQGWVKNYVSIFADISVIKTAEQRLTHLAHYDTLTGLPNRFLFIANLERALERAKRQHTKIALLYLDLDRFKRVNDSLGHHAGDNLLQEIGNRLTANVRAEDLVARLGGDEFTILLEGISIMDDAAIAAQKIIDAVAAPLVIEGRELVTSTSIGISLFPDDADDVKTLVKNADSAMYRAKERGRNTYEYFTQALNVRMQEHLLLEAGLRKALIQEGELELFYQPQLETATGRVMGMEALIRWHHPMQGLILPDRFISMAEESGLIRTVDEWVIRQACAQAKQWIQSGLQPKRIGINLSGKHIFSRNLPDLVRSAINDSELHPGDVEIEIEVTESAFQSMEESLDALDQLRALGVKIAIDDFGTGYSSLSRLQQLPIDTLKIDKAFLVNISENANNRALTSAIVSMGHNLGLRVVAEGVENKPQLEFLREQGCDEVQGYLLGKPISADAMTQMLKKTA